MTLRKEYFIAKPGSLKRLKLREAPLAACADHEVQVSVKAIGLNYADIFAIIGLYKAAPKDGFVPGLEFSGEITFAGKNVSGLKVGDRVMGVTKFGAYANTINIDARYVIPIPESWSYDEGAAFPVQVLTAYYALLPLGNLQKGQTVLIHSAAGGVGLLANRIAKKFDAYTIGVIGHSSKKEILEKEKYDAIIVRDNNFRENLHKALKGKELNLVLETTGGKYFYDSYHALAAMGRIVSYGSAQFTPSGAAPNYLTLIFKYLFRPKVDPLTMITENKSLLAFNLIWLYERTELMKAMMDEVNKLQLPAPYIGHHYSFEELPAALDFFKSGKSIGKIIVNV